MGGQAKSPVFLLQYGRYCRNIWSISAPGVHHQKELRSFYLSSFSTMPIWHYGIFPKGEAGASVVS